MRDELKSLQAAIEAAQLPSDFNTLFGDLWDTDAKRFHVQETYILDYKETVPTKFSDSYGAGIVRLAIAFYNSFGGIIVFGVKDRELSITGVDRPFDVESLNRVLSDCAGMSVECVTKSYSVATTLGSSDIAVVLVPRRGPTRPAKLLRQVGEYLPGKTWIRDRAEVLESGSKHLPLLYSNRRSLPSDLTDDNAIPIHRSFPPSPSTMKSFIGRAGLIEKLWDWFIFGDQRRLYLHGPGGSGKTTLAFEFARMLAETGQHIQSPSGDHLDYVIFISGKETELNPYTGKQEVFALRQFENAREQYAQLLYHSGLLDQEEIATADEAKLDLLLDDLFSNFSGLIVIDDIDALSRKKLDTGEETLFTKAILAKKRTRILYTLRFPPPHAIKSALEVPGLDENAELMPFIELCSTQFNIPRPQSKDMPRLKEKTSSLPLLVETVLGLRKFTSTYIEAIQTFEDKGGEEARRYLYQREYDRLSKEGKSRQVLAGLMLLEAPVSFGTLSQLFQFPHEHVRDALIECSSVFLTTSDNEKSGETLYQLTPPCVPFIRQVSEGLPYFNKLKTTVEHFRKVKSSSSPREAALIVSLERMVRQKQFDQAVTLGRSLPHDDSALINPKVRSLLGQANSELGQDFREEARKWFKAAEGLGHWDVFMMRRWYNMEILSGYNSREAERICTVVLNDEKLANRYKSEFLSKLAKCYSFQASSIINADYEKGTGLLRQSVDTYMEALWIGTGAYGFDLSETLVWLERTAQRFFEAIRDNIEQIFILLEGFTHRKHDVPEEGAMIVLNSLLQAPVPVHRKDVRNRLKGLCTRTIKKINQPQRPLADNPGFKMIVFTLEDIRSKAEQFDAPPDQSSS